MVQDQVLEETEEEFAAKDQRVRRESTIRAIFKEAGLHVFKETALEELVPDKYPVKTWVLYPTE